MSVLSLHVFSADMWFARTGSLIVLAVLIVALAGAIPASAQQAPLSSPVSSAPGVGAWQPGPAAVGDRTNLAGVIDTPSAGATVAPGGLLHISGWFVDLGAQGWSGGDDVEVFLGTIEGGGKPLGHAQLGQNRPDVAAALKDPFWAASGWSATVTLPALALGPTTVSIYVHTPDRGWWLRQVPLTVGIQPTLSVPARSTPAATAAPPIPSATPTSPFGNDISWPQCSTAAEPSGPAFAILGINAGKPFTSNPCLPREYFWALSAASSSQPRVGVYMNTANPGQDSPNWPSSSTTAPRACDGTATADCAYDYGWLAAQYAFARAVGVLGAPAATQVSWWLDVEQANSWSATDLAANAASVHGNIDFLRSVGVSSIGIYSTSTDWEALIGPPQPNADPFGTLPNWRPGASGPQDAPAWCSRTVSGGKVKYVQFQSSGFDTDLACF